MSDYPVIQLLPWEFREAASVGAGRTCANWNKPDKQRYAEGKEKGLLQDNLTAGIQSCMCEIAVAKHLNQYWASGVWWTSDGSKKYGRLADVGEDIEVRRTRTDTVKVDRDDAGKIVWGARVADYERGRIEILGWIEADYVINTFLRGTIDSYKHFPIEELKPPGESAKWMPNLSEGTPRGPEDALVDIRDHQHS
jgi:hypothetical protein